MTPTPVPTRAIEGACAAHASLLAAIAGLTDEVARRPSLLPDWTVGHVLTHVARNADSVVRRLDGAIRGEVVDQYVGGATGRAADIEAGAGRPAAALVADVSASAAAVEAACERMPAQAWGRLTRGVSGKESPAAAVVTSRWHEVEVHHVDLGLGYRPADWPPDMVTDWLPRLLSGVAARTDERALLGWLIGRGPAPALDPW